MGNLSKQSNDAGLVATHRPRPAYHQLIDPTVGREGDRLQARLADTDPAAITVDILRHEVEGNLWMLTPEAFRYFLPTFLSLGVAHYDQLGAFVAELVTALTEPTREDVVLALDRMEHLPVQVLGMAPAPLGPLRKQQLDWFDSGEPVERYQARIDTLSEAEGGAILRFLTILHERHAGDFPFDELDIAIQRHWGRYQAT